MANPPKFLQNVSSKQIMNHQLIARSDNIHRKSRAIPRCPRNTSATNRGSLLRQHQYITHPHCWCWTSETISNTRNRSSIIFPLPKPLLLLQSPFQYSIIYFSNRHKANSEHPGLARWLVQVGRVRSHVSCRETWGLFRPRCTPFMFSTCACLSP